VGKGPEQSGDITACCLISEGS